MEQIRGIGAPVTGCSGPTDSRFSPAMSWRWLTLEQRCQPIWEALTVGAVNSEWASPYRFRGCFGIAAAGFGGI